MQSIHPIKVIGLEYLLGLGIFSIMKLFTWTTSNLLILQIGWLSPMNSQIIKKKIVLLWCSSQLMSKKKVIIHFIFIKKSLTKNFELCCLHTLKENTIYIFSYEPACFLDLIIKANSFEGTTKICSNSIWQNMKFQVLVC